MLAEQPQHLLLGISIKFTGWLVGQYDVWVVRQRYGQPGPGELAAGQLRRVGAPAGGETDLFQQLVSTVLRCHSAAGQLGDPHVAAHVEMLQQVPGL
jgi:hypothetical protein